MTLPRVLRLMVVAVPLSSACWSGQAASHGKAPPAMTVEVSLVLVPVTVTDRSGRTVTGLDRGRFQVFEEGVPQRIASFSSEDAPVSLGLIFDISGSMRQKIGTARASLNALLAAAASGDEALLLTCATRPALQSELTADVEGIEGLLRAARAGGRTALIDSVSLALDRMKRARNRRRALVVVSDGQDNFSRRSRRELLSRAVESDVQIYTIGIYEPPRTRKAIELVEEVHGMALLDDLARATGGLHYRIRSGEEVAEAAARIGLVLHQQYVLGYYPADLSRAGWRRIRVKLDIPNVRLYARSRYRTPLPHGRGSE